MDTLVSTNPKARNGRRSQPERRREAEHRLLRAAEHIVAERGLERFTLAEVGEAAGYSRGLPAHYFGSKEGLVGALATEIVNGFGRSAARTEKHPAGLERLLGVASHYFESAGRDPVRTRVLFAVLGEALTNEALRTRISELNAHSVKPIADNILAGIAAGDIRRSINANVQAMLILSGLRGAVAQWLIDPRHIDLKAVRAEFIASLKRSLGP